MMVMMMIFILFVYILVKFSRDCSETTECSFLFCLILSLRNKIAKTKSTKMKINYVWLFY